jgi:hypothetical protein
MAEVDDDDEEEEDDEEYGKEGKNGVLPCFTCDMG